MKRWMVGLGVLALAGCASSTKLENEARVHTLRADAAARTRQYDVAAREQQEADRLHQKAQKKAYKEGRSDIVIPADVPVPATPRAPDTSPQ
jgi:outer membrane murein-binding lipoprotein Lpp